MPVIVMHAIASRYRELIVVGNRPRPVKMRLTQLAVYNSKIVRKNMKSKVVRYQKLVERSVPKITIQDLKLMIATRSSGGRDIARCVDKSRVLEITMYMRRTDSRKHLENSECKI